MKCLTFPEQLQYFPQFTSDEDQKNFEKLSELVEKLQGKTRTYKKQIEDAEEIAALNLAKFRKAQQQLEEAEDRSQAAENHMGRWVNLKTIRANKKFAKLTILNWTSFKIFF